MYLHIGDGVLVRQKKLIGIFNLDKIPVSSVTHDFLKIQGAQGGVAASGSKLPRSFCVTDDGIYLSPINTSTLAERIGRP